MRFSESFYTHKQYKGSDSYIYLGNELKDQEDLVDGFVHLEAAYHDLDDIVDSLRVCNLLRDLLLLTLLIPEEDSLVVIVKAY